MIEHILEFIVGILGLVTCWGICIVLRNMHREHFGVAFYDPDLILFKENCQFCSGGVQGLVKGEDGRPAWGPIPKEWQMEQREGDNRGWFSSPIANRRTCKHCHGVGHRLVDRSAVDLPYPRP